MIRFAIVLLISGTCLSHQLLNLEEGSRCTWNQISGECVSVYKCLSSFLDVDNRDFAPICSFRNKEPIVCCTDCTYVNDTRQIFINPHIGLLEKKGQKAEDKCIEYIHKLDYSCKTYRRANLTRRHLSELNCNHVAIEFNNVFAAAGGSNAKRQQFPHMALLGYGEFVKSADWLCGGTVISERFILTAGHCLSSPSLGQVKYAALGILKRTDPIDLWQIYNIKKSIPHPEYKPPYKYHDIALLETDTEIVFSNAVLPACLHTKGEAEEFLSATGWGALGHRQQLADTLQDVLVSRFEEHECAKHYPPHRHLKRGYNHSTQMCYGDVLKPKDTCQGDSGGPLQSKNYDEYFCTFTILGVTSYGRQCGITAGSGIYTRVIYYVPWIESIVWP